MFLFFRIPYLVDIECKGTLLCQQTSVISETLFGLTGLLVRFTLLSFMYA